MISPIPGHSTEIPITLKEMECAWRSSISSTTKNLGPAPVSSKEVKLPDYLASPKGAKVLADDHEAHPNPKRFLIGLQPYVRRGFRSFPIIKNFMGSGGGSSAPADPTSVVFGGVP